MAEEKKDVVMPDAKLQAVSENADVAEVNLNNVKKVPFKQRLKNYFRPEGVQKEMLRYRTNKGAEYLVFLGLACVVAGFSTIYGYITIVDWMTGIDILTALIILLFSFLASQEVKDYSKTWSYLLFVLAGGILLRLIYPIYLHAPTSTGAVPLETVRFTAVIILYIVGAVSYVLAGALGLYRGAALRSYLATVEHQEGDKF